MEVPQIADFERVCVTGAGGFVGSWLVKKLLERGYNVNATVREPDDPKNQHLKSFEGANSGLVVVKADILNYSSLLNAMRGCRGVFHVACPISDDPNQVIEPAVKGTLNVMNAAAELGMKRVVLTSSIGTVYLDPRRPAHTQVDESCWSDLNHCMETKNWYCYAKTVAERSAWEIAKEKGIDMVVVIPAIVSGPTLSRALSRSMKHIIRFLDGSAKSYRDMVNGYVDVEDVADAHILVYQHPKASGRYLLVERMLSRGELLKMLGEMFPSFPIPTKCNGKNSAKVESFTVSTKKIGSLGFKKFIPMEESLRRSVEGLVKHGLLSLPSKM